MLIKSVLVKKLEEEKQGTDGGFVDGINSALNLIDELEIQFYETVNKGLFLAMLEEIETYGAVMTTKSSTGGRCISLAFTKIQEARHWVEQDVKEYEIRKQAEG